MNNLIPMVVEQSNRGERAYDIYSRLLKERIKVGLILNAFGEENKVHVHENEVQAEIQKQLKMIPGQE